MRRPPSTWLPLFALLLLLLPRGAIAESRDRISEIEPTALEAWESHGFRVQLRFGLESLLPSDAPTRLIDQGMDHFAIAVEPGVRWNRWWSFSGTMRYAILAERDGLRWTTTGDVSFHPFHGFFLSGGVGYGGMLGDLCDGSGLALVARTGWLLPLGEVFATGPVAQTDLQHTRCRRDGPDRPFRHLSHSVSWSFAWR